MEDPGRVIKVGDAPVFLFTDYLRTCVGAIAKCKIADSSYLIGVSHLYSDQSDYHFVTEEYPPFPDTESFLRGVDRQSVIQKGHFKPHKLDDLMDQFFSHPNYNGETIELFLAGGNGKTADILFCDLLVEYAKTVPRVSVTGTHFNPYQTTQELEDDPEIKAKPLVLLAGITNRGSIYLSKLLDVSFSSSSILANRT